MRRPQIKLIYFCIEDGNSPLFNDQLLIKRADNVPRKVTKYPADWTHSSIQIDKNLDRYIDRLSADSRPIHRTAIFWVSTKCRPTIDRVLTKYRPTIGEVSAKSRRSVGERKAISAETHLERLSTAISTHYRPIVDRLSTKCRPTIDRLSTYCRPLYRSIDKSTLPTVNMIRVTPSSISIILHKILTLIH